MAESFQHYLDRNRPPRVQITYDVEIGGAIEMKELPFVVGILADLSGTITTADRATRLPIKERKFVEIDRDNFNEVLRSIGPKLDLKVIDANKSQNSEGTPKDLDLTLRFNSLDDFSPLRLLTNEKNEGLGEVHELLKARQRLSDLLTKLDGNDDLEELLTQALTHGASQEKLASDTALLAPPDSASVPTPPPAPEIVQPNPANPDNNQPALNGGN